MCEYDLSCHVMEMVKQHAATSSGDAGLPPGLPEANPEGLAAPCPATLNMPSLGGVIL
jgi:hypothetical protein